MTLNPQGREEMNLSNNNDYKIKIICWLVAIISLVVVASHNFFPTHNPEFKGQNLKYKEIISERNSAYSELKEAFLRSTDLNTENYKLLMTNYLNLQDKSSKEFKELIRIKNETKFYNFKNKNVFFYQVSVFLVILFVSILFKFLALRLEYDSLKKTYQSISVVFISISFYYIVWIFYYKSDLPHFAHVTAIACIAILIGKSVSVLINWLYYRKSILAIHKYNFRNLWRFIIHDIPTKHIREKDRNEYVKDYTKEIIDFKIPEE